MTGMGFQVISFAYDDAAHRPELCMTLLRIVLIRFQGDPSTAEWAFGNGVMQEPAVPQKKAPA